MFRLAVLKSDRRIGLAASRLGEGPFLRVHLSAVVDQPAQLADACLLAIELLLFLGPQRAVLAAGAVKHGLRVLVQLDALVDPLSGLRFHTPSVCWFRGLCAVA